MNSAQRYWLNILILLLFTILYPISFSHSEAVGVIKVDSGNGLISINAQDYSLKKIIKELNKKTDGVFISHLKEDETVTVKTENLNLRQTIARLREFADINYIADEKDKTVTKVLVFNKGEYFKSKSTKESNNQKRTTSRPQSDTSESSGKRNGDGKAEPLGFEFNPADYIRE